MPSNPSGRSMPTGIRRGRGRAVSTLLLGVSLLCGCAWTPIQRKDGSTTARAYAIENVAKSDVDLVTELTQREVLRGLTQLTEKLYRRNPQEYRKAGLDSPDKAVARIFDALPGWAESPMARADWMQALRLAFSETYTGDRVHAFMLGLTSMVMASYDHRTEFYLIDDLDAQKLYNSARNIEIAAWKLAHARMSNGQPMLLSNAPDEETLNLSFEREFGKLIARQDLLALIIEDKSNRTVTKVIQNMASFVLLPI